MAPIVTARVSSYLTPNTVAPSQRNKRCVANCRASSGTRRLRAMCVQLMHSLYHVLVKQILATAF